MSYRDIHGDTKNAVNFLDRVGVISGYADGTYRPDSYVTKAEACVYIEKFCMDSIDFSYQEIDNYSEIEREYGLKDHWARSFIAYMIELFQRNQADSFLSTREQIKPNDLITVGEYVNWLSKFSEIIYDVNLDINQKGFPHSDLNDNLRRGTLAEILFFAATDIVRQYKGHYGYFGIMFFEKWATLNNGKYRPNPALFLVDNIMGNSAFEIISISYMETSFEKQNELMMRMGNLAEKINNVKKREGYYSGSAYQYTSIDSLKNMLEKSSFIKEGKTCISLHMSNAEYLNDPEEGRMFRNWLDENGYYSDVDENIVTKEGYVLSLISEKEELLPMWALYGNCGTGCRIEFEVTKEHEFVRVEYVDYDNKVSLDLLDELNEFVIKIDSDIIKSAVRKWARKELEKLGYCYKSNYYEYETEVRAVYSAKATEALIMTNLDDGLGKLYIKNPIPFKVKSVILGPQCKNPRQIALVLGHYGIHNVKVSNIKFR